MAKLASDQTPWNTSLHTTATYEAWPDYVDSETSVPSTYKDIHVHMAQIDANVRVRIRVELIDNTTIHSLELKPSRITSLAVTQTVDAKSVEFEVDPFEFTRSILVEINEPLNSPALNHGLMVFVNPMSIAPTGDDVLTLPSGIVDKTTAPNIINENDTLLIDTDSPYKKVYIPRDTIINGRIQAKKRGVSISGRGMVVGSRWLWPKTDPDWRNKPYTVTPDGSLVKGLVEINSGSLEGITSVLPYHFNFVGGLTSTNLKAFGWRHSTDGIHGVSTVRGCFTKVNDDHIYFPNRDIQFSAFWGMSNGTVFQGGWSSEGDKASSTKGGYVGHNDILRGEWTEDGGARQNNGIFGSVDQASRSHTGATFEDIRIQGPVCRMLNFEMRTNTGIWKDLLFKDIWFEKPLGCLAGQDLAQPSLDNLLIMGGALQNITFDNVFINGNKISTEDQLMPLQKLNSDNILFK